MPRSTTLPAIPAATSGDDLITATPRDGSLYGGDGNDTLLGSTSYDSLYGEGDDDLLDGAGDDDSLDGGDGHDTLLGGAGDDWLVGGAGNDVLNGGAGVDDVSYLDAPMGVTVSLALAGAQNTGGAGIDRLIDVEGLVGSDFADALGGSDADNSLYGFDGDDTLGGGRGADFLNGGRDDDSLDGGEGNDEMDGGFGHDTLKGGAGDDRLEGDWSTSGPADAGRDWLDGGEGNDVAIFTGATTSLHVDLRITGWQDTGGAGLDRLTGLEHLFGGWVDDLLVGDDRDNRLDGWRGNDALQGGAGNDTLIGDYGADTLQGGAGDDVLTGTAYPHWDGISVASYADAEAAVAVSLALQGAQDTGGAGIDSLSRIRALLGSDHGDRLTGADTDDVLDGGAGNDTLDGGRGTDIASYDSAPSGVMVSLASTGIQPTQGAGSDRLLGFEQLAGSRFNDSLTGDDADNTLEGGLGNDTLSGGAGRDTASYAGATSAVSVNLALAGLQATGSVGADRLLDIEGLLGSVYGDQLSGNEQGNRLRGGDGKDTLLGAGGDDTLKGGEGADRLDGGAGNDLVFGGNGHGGDLLMGGAGIDTLSYGSQAEGVYIRLDVPSHWYEADTVEGFENLIGTSQRDTLGGDAGDNRLSGGEGIDTLLGDAGDDTLAGGDGSDRADYGHVAAGITLNLSLDTAQPTGGAGTDTLLSIRHLVGSAYADVLTGNGQANLIDGGDGSDSLAGGEGDDSLDGGVGVDTLSGGAGNDWLEAGNALGGDLLKGGDGNDWATFIDAEFGVVVGLGNDIGPVDKAVLQGIEHLHGSYHDDHLKGDAGDNLLDGGYGGADTLTGGAGADQFWVDAYRPGIDLVTDFVSGTDQLKAMNVLNYNETVYRGELVSGPGGFRPDGNLVVVTTNISGEISAASAAARIGSATGPIKGGRDMMFVVDNGRDSAAYAFRSWDGDARVEADELTLIALLQGTASTTLADYVLG